MSVNDWVTPTSKLDECEQEAHMASDTEAEDADPAQKSFNGGKAHESMPMMMRVPKKVSVVPAQKLRKEEPKSPTAHLRTRAAKHVLRMQLSIKQAFEAE